MSSEGSVSTSTSSRIRQFGLYRTIDARTEEFLRPSRKRQIKQGCACAAISTAITVTVVITVFLVYMEYGMNTDANQQSLGKAGWIGLLNDSLASSFEEKFSKSKINFDRNTIKLLPLIIKALKQNRYLEKIIEDYSSSSPAYDGKVTTEFTFKKDIFLNTKNWMKKPSSKLYTIEYKTSPIVMLKNPTKQPGYFTKNRKIRDYKRIIEYVEKMINDKVGLGATVPMTFKKHELQTENTAEKPQKTSKLIPKTKFNKKHRNPNKKTFKKKVLKPTDVVSCKCPKQLGLILDKIFSSFQHLIPDDKITQPGPCSGDQETNTLEANTDIAFYPPTTKVSTTTTSTTLISNAITSTEKKQQSIPVKFSEFDNVYHKETTVSPEETTVSPQETTVSPQETTVSSQETTVSTEETTQPVGWKYLNNWKVFETNRQDNTHMFKNEDTTAQAFNSPTQSLRLPFLENRNEIHANDFGTYHVRTTTTYDHIEPTEAHYYPTITTQSMSPTIDIMEKEKNHNTTTTTEKNLLLESEEVNKMQSNFINKNFHRTTHNQNFKPNTNIMKLKNNDHTTITTTTYNVLDEENEYLDIHSFELLKSKLLSPNKRLNLTVKYPVSSIEDKYTSSTTKSSTTEVSTTEASTTEGSTTEASSTESSTTESSDEESTTASSTEVPKKTALRQVHRYVSKTITNEKSTETNKISKSNVNYKAVAPLMISKNTTNKSMENVTSDQEKNKQEPFYLGLDNIALEEEIEKIARDDEYPDELSSNRTESASQSAAAVINSTTALQDASQSDFWQMLKNNERFFSPSSMLPQYRPTYLEIHRNDWKHEDNKDYDTDMKYNIFDLL